MTVTRRSVLRTLFGAGIALPVLSSLEWLRGRRTVARADDARMRFAVFVRGANGVQQASMGDPERFWPRTFGPIDRTSIGTDNADRAIAELAPYAPRMLVIKGLRRPFPTPECGHSESAAQCLTAVPNTGGDGNAPLALGLSADWRIANQLHPGRAPMVLMEGPPTSFIGEMLSWRGPRNKTPAERSPRNQYLRMMGLTGAPPEIRRRIVEGRMSVNDLVRDQVRDILGNPDVSAFDRRRLTQHLESIRDTELAVMACELDPAWLTELDALGDINQNDVRLEVARRHMDVIALGLSCGYARAATLQIGEGQDRTQHDIDGVRVPPFHWISHRLAGDARDGTPIPNAVELHHRIDRIQLGLFRYLLDRLDAMPSPVSGSLLDDGVTVWLNDLADGPPHGGVNVPWIAVGGCGGRLRSGRFIDAGGAAYNAPLNTILSAVGCTHDDGSPVDDFGDPSLPRGFLPDTLVL